MEGAKGKKDGSQNYILQINKSSEDILYERFRKITGSVYLPLKSERWKRI